jgi:HD-like signal output (HDOD) protein/ActR/RegA family two-component response regulator
LDGLAGSGNSRPKARVLFVDDEPEFLEILERVMPVMGLGWEARFARSGREALALLNQQPCDVVVSDMRMPDMMGSQLLNTVFRDHPKTVRIILSGYCKCEDVLTCAGAVHRYLHKPLPLAELMDCLRDIAVMNDRFHNNDALRGLVASIACPPIVPECYLEVVGAVQSPEFSIQRIGEIAARDPALSAKLLHLANSAFFGYGRAIHNVVDAVQVLGVNVVKSLALAAPLFSSFDPHKCPAFPVRQVWEHSLQTGVLGARIAGLELDELRSEQAFTVGVMHDIGKLILADQVADRYGVVLAEAAATGRPLFEVELKHLGATHADIGGYLLGLWNLPLPLVEAVTHHHEPQGACKKDFGLVDVLYVANLIEHEQNAEAHPAHSVIDLHYLEDLGVKPQRLENWRNYCQVK